MRPGVFLSGFDNRRRRSYPPRWYEQLIPETDDEYVKLDLSKTDRVAVIGVAKNSGKTTTLNALIGSEPAGPAPIGLVSVGIDGESVDALVGIDKPTLWLPGGTLVASAHRALEASEARFEYLESLGFSTPLGETVIARVRQAGDVLLAGMRHRGDLRTACDRLEHCGVRRVFVDGAYDRMSAATGEVAGGVVLSTGAILGSRVETIVEKTRPWLERIQLPPVSKADDRELIEWAIAAEAACARWSNGETTRSEGSALLGLDALRQPDGRLTALAIPGLVSDSVVDSLMTLHAECGVERPRILVRDPTVFRMDPQTWHRLTNRWEPAVVHGTSLLGVSVNPTGIHGGRVSRAELVEALSAHCDCVVFDPRAPRTSGASLNDERSQRA